MNLFALLSHTLAQHARSPVAHRLRTGSLLLVTWLLIVAHASAAMYEGVGCELIRMLTGLDMLLIVVAGSSHFGSVITEEKEQGTLGLLKLAGFSNLGLLLGKSVGRVLSVLMIFLLQLPFAFLGVMLGGVSATQVLAAFVALAAFMILVGNLGLFFSLVSRRNAQAVLLTTFAGLWIVAGDEILGFILAAPLPNRWNLLWSGLHQLKELQETISINNRLQVIVELRGISIFGGQCGWSLLIAGGLFVASWLLFDRFTESSESVGLERRDSKRKWRFWSTTAVWQNSIAWKEFHFPSGGWGYWLAKLLLLAGAVIAGIAFAEPYQQWTSSDLRKVVAYACLGLAVAEIFLFASNMLGDEYLSGTLPNLALIPQPLRRIVLSKLAGGFLGLVPSITGAVAAVLVAGPRSLYDGPPMRLGSWVAGLGLLFHLTVFYSLKVKRGAVAFAIVTLVLGAVVLLPALSLATAMLGGGSQRAIMEIEGPEAWAPLVYVAVFGCIALQVATVIAFYRAAKE